MWAGFLLQSQHFFLFCIFKEIESNMILWQILSFIVSDLITFHYSIPQTNLELNFQLFLKQDALEQMPSGLGDIFSGKAVRLHSCFSGEKLVNSGYPQRGRNDFCTTQTWSPSRLPVSCQNRACHCVSAFLRFPQETLLSDHCDFRRHRGHMTTEKSEEH